MEDAILDTLTFLEEVDFGMIFKMLGLGYAVFWIVVVGWTWMDASERFNSIVMRIVSVLVVLFFNIFGFIIYLIIRPKVTREEEYWSDLERRYLEFEAAGLEDCPNCGNELHPNFIFCPRCGYDVRVKCGGCEVYLEREWRVCPFCGKKQPKRKDDLAQQQKKFSKDKVKSKQMPAVEQKQPSEKKPQGPGIFKKSVDSVLDFLQFIGSIPFEVVDKTFGAIGRAAGSAKSASKSKKSGEDKQSENAKKNGDEKGKSNEESKESKNKKKKGGK